MGGQGSPLLHKFAIRGKKDSEFKPSTNTFNNKTNMHACVNEDKNNNFHLYLD